VPEIFLLNWNIFLPRSPKKMKAGSYLWVSTDSRKQSGPKNPPGMDQTHLPGSPPEVFHQFKAFCTSSNES